MERKSLTLMQEKIYNYIKESIEVYHMSPTFREIGNAVGLRSTSTVYVHISALEDKGYILRDPTKPRTLQLTEEPKREGIPLIGSVTAGEPVLAVEQIEEYLPVGQTLFPDADYALRIKGDSMIEAGIYDGDIVIVKSDNMADNGDIVVAMLHEEATVKKLVLEGTETYLKPCNDKYRPIHTQNLHIAGRVIGLIRKGI